MMTEYALGCDVSHWQGQVDFARMYDAGARFVFLKASQSTWTDKMFVQNYKSALKTPLLVGMYHYLDWTKPAEQQAQYFAKLVKDYPPDLPPVLDYECRTNAPIPEKALREAATFLETLAYIAGRKPMIYTSRGYWLEFGTNEDWWRDTQLWLAFYPVTQIGLSDIIPPRPWRSIEFWQFTDRGDGAMFGVQSKQVDLNYFNGTEQDLITRYGADLDLPKPENTAVRVEVIAKVNVRFGPTVASKVVDVLQVGDEIELKGIRVESANRVWVKHDKGWSALVYNGKVFMREVS